MNKVYSRINWENYPSDATPLNETNLNTLDYATDEIDNRVITLDTTKLPWATAYTMVKDVSYDESNGVFTITYLNGATYTLDTKLEKLAVNFSYDASTEQLIITLDDGTKQYVDLSALITEYEFLDSDIVLFTVDTDGKVSATIADGSITEDKLQPDYLAEIKVEAAAASASATSAATSAETATSKATAAANSASAASTSAKNAASSAETAEDYATLAESYAVGGTGTRTGEDTDNAKYYSEQAATSATSASTSASTATTKASAAATSATSASTSASTATTKASAAATSATSAASSAKSASTSAETAEDYAVGDTDSAKYYYEQAKAISESFSGALRPMGTVTFANLPSLSSATEGDMYNVSDEFTTTSSFKEGSGLTIAAGSNVYKTSDGYWDVLAGSPVTGVKGNAESSYRRGNVNLTPANIGALASSTTYAASTSVGGSATTATTTADTSSTIYPVGVTSSATTALKRDTSVTMAGGTVTATTFSGALSGNASTATKLATARTVRTNLGSTSTASFDGSANVTPGVTGTLPIANGGTGNTTGNAATATALATARTIDGVSFDGSAAITHYGVCSTAAATAAKTVSCDGFSLVTGAEITVYFTYGNTSSSATLNVNGTGAKSIIFGNYRRGSDYLVAGGVYKFVYNGTYYIPINNMNLLSTPVSLGSTSSTSITTINYMPYYQQYNFIYAHMYAYNQIVASGMMPMKFFLDTSSLTLSDSTNGGWWIGLPDSDYHANIYYDITGSYLAAKTSKESYPVYVYAI